MQDVTLAILCDDQAPGSARRFVGAVLDEWACRCAAEDARLLVSELVTNAVLHSGCPLARVRLSRHHDRVRCEVCDPGRPGDVAPRRTAPGEVGGLGLRIVDSLSSSWGVRLDDDGTAVWFELPVACPAPPGRPAP